MLPNLREITGHSESPVADILICLYLRTGLTDRVSAWILNAARRLLLITNSPVLKVEEAASSSGLSQGAHIN